MSTKRILITDDDPVVRMILSSVLANAGYDVTQVEAGVDCLQALEQSVTEARPYMAMFLDYQLPDMSGGEIIAELRNGTSVNPVPIIMLSANSESEVEDSLRMNPPDLYLQKPFVSQSVLEALASIQTL